MSEEERFEGPADATIVLPLEVRFRFRGAGRTISVAQQIDEVGLERVVIQKPYDNRQGYEPAFLPGIKVELPGLPPGAQPAPLIEGIPDGVLRYEHFSVVVNPDEARRMAFYTATNIDGATYIEIDRKTGLPEEEASEMWFDDDRMAPQYYLGQDFYSAHSEYFDRGHLTRRSDTNWGTKQRAVRANADTFHRTNCTPQHWLFNQSAKYWQGVETHYLEYGAIVDKSRLTVLQGPVFDDANDTKYKDDEGKIVLVPSQFWKVIVRVVNDELKATALLVSQKELLSKKRRGVRPGGDGEKPNVDQYLCSMKRLQGLTKLGFDPVLLKGDTFQGGGLEAAESMGLRPIRRWADLT